MEEKGYIFDIKRFATHDGAGIRTTIFLKGCTLKCVWCQNPEGISFKQRPLFFKNKCINCGTCLSYCRDGGMVREEDGKIHLYHERDENWDEIIYHCPAVAIAMDSEVYTVSEAMEEAVKDKVFFRENGGLTLSGGEPLYQSKFAIALLKRAKEQGLNTSIETALNVPTKTVAAALEHLDAVYADMKICDGDLHKKYTGVANELIKQNLEFLLTSAKKDAVIIRTPLIPGITTTDENLAGIAEFLSGIYPDVCYELLNYNPLAKAKYEMVEKEYCFEDNPKMFTKNEMIHFGDIVKQHGIKNLILEI